MLLIKNESSNDNNLSNDRIQKFLIRFFKLLKTYDIKKIDILGMAKFL